jgi:2',3'-cyclic-nucleotide 2'-phosphodiesterase/3'-nucleotidase/5'-nucleotidase
MPRLRSSPLSFIVAFSITAGVGCSSADSSFETVEADDTHTEQTSEALSSSTLSMSVLGTFRTTGAIEISAYDPCTKRLFSVNSLANRIEVIDISRPGSPVSAGVIPLPGVPNSVAVHDGRLAVASEAAPVRTDPGNVKFYDTSTLALLREVQVGAIPDMVTFTPDGKKLLVANEGEPAPDYAFDPEGSVSIIDVSRRGDYAVKTVRFLATTPLVHPESIRIYGPGATMAQDFEPEYMTISDDSKTAYVTLQENNAIAIVDISDAKFTSVVGLGFKDHSLPGNGLDPSDKDGAIAIANWPVHGMYQPDSIAHFKSRGTNYLITANEGDAREWGSYKEEARIKDLIAAGKIDPASPVLAFGADSKLGRLTVTTKTGDTDGDGDLDELYAFGARSFSIWSTSGAQVYDSGDDIEQRVAAANPAAFNADQTAPPGFDTRSDNKGPEPEGIAVGKVHGHTYAFVGLERVGGVVVYDVSNPRAPQFVTYVNNRNFSAPTAATAGDLGPEGLLFIEGSDSPTHRPILVVSNEISGTMTMYDLGK